MGDAVQFNPEAASATGPLFKMKNDPRVTRIGCWMRKFSIDEFPQLLNVLRGDMSLIMRTVPAVLFAKGAY